MTEDQPTANPPAPDGDGAPLSETKPFTHSATIWGGIAAVLSGLGTLAMVAAGLATADTVYPALISIWGGAQAIWGRFRARTLVA